MPEDPQVLQERLQDFREAFACADAIERAHLVEQIRAAIDELKSHMLQCSTALADMQALLEESSSKLKS